MENLGWIIVIVVWTGIAWGSLIVGVIRWISQRSRAANGRAATGHHLDRAAEAPQQNNLWIEPKAEVISLMDHPAAAPPVPPLLDKAFTLPPVYAGVFLPVNISPTLEAIEDDFQPPASPPVPAGPSAMARQHVSSQKPAPSLVQKPIVPVDFDRHDNKPGWLYLARNDEYRPGLYKMGLSGTPDVREVLLNQSNDTALDIGEVRILHKVAVPAMGLAEKALFSVCAPRRISQKSEYFMGSESVFRRALEAIAAHARGNAQPLEIFKASQPFAGLDDMPEPFWGMPRVETLSRSPGVYLMRNPWHAENVYRYVCTKLPGEELLRVMESRQRRGNGVFGFYRVVAVFSVTDPNAAKSTIRAAAVPWTFSARFSFLRGERSVIESMLSETLAGLSPRPKYHEGMVAEPVESINKSEEPWNPPCPTCGQILRFRRAKIGARETLGCPSCAEPMQVHIGPAYATASLLN